MKLISDHLLCSAVLKKESKIIKNKQQQKKKKKKEKKTRKRRRFFLKQKWLSVNVGCLSWLLKSCDSQFHLFDPQIFRQEVIVSLASNFLSGTLKNPSTQRRDSTT